LKWVIDDIRSINQINEKFTTAIEYTSLIDCDKSCSTDRVGGISSTLEVVIDCMTWIRGDPVQHTAAAACCHGHWSVNQTISKSDDMLDECWRLMHKLLFKLIGLFL